MSDGQPEKTAKIDRSCNSLERQECWVRTPDGLRLWSERIGPADGRPLLLIMGAMNPGLVWPEGFCARLVAAGHAVIRYDARDTGWSSSIDFAVHPYTLDEMAADALAVLQAHGVARAAVVGLSMGGYVAQLLALAHPERLSALVLLSTSADHRPYMAATLGGDLPDSPLPGPESMFIDHVRRTVSQPPQTPAALVAAQREGWALTYGGSAGVPWQHIDTMLAAVAGRNREPLAAFNHARAVAASPDRLAAVCHIALPTLVMHGLHDALLPIAHGRDLAQRIPGARLLELDMGHSFMGACDEAVLAAIIGFVAGQAAQQ
mgnify:CR=1 FL=1